MSYSLVIRTFDDAPIKKGDFSCSKNFYKEVLDHFPAILKLQMDQLNKCLLIFAKPIDYDKKAIVINICELKIEKDSIYIKFTIIGESQLTTSQVRKKLYNTLIEKHILKDNRFLPLLCLLDEEQTKYIFRQKSDQQNNILQEIQKYQQNNDWNNIYSLFQPISKLKDNPQLWNDYEILAALGFALGKLAETNELPKAIFKDDKKKKEYLKNQFILRNETELIRRRVVEITPHNASSWSNLAYLYYQNSLELVVPKGRRDGNINEEIEKAVDNINKALSIDETRVTDLYRKGRLLSRILPKNILFGRKNHELGYNEINKQINEFKKEGINALNLAVKHWESLDPNVKRENDKKNRTKSSYIESLYNLGKVYFGLVSSDWDESIFLLHLRQNVSANDSISYIPQDLENINKSINFFEKCCWSDSKELDSATMKIIEMASEEGVISSVDKLYSLGKVYFTKYWILSGYGQKDTSENIKIRVIAKEFYEKALFQSWPLNKSKQRKDFIAERLARLLISEGNYKDAIFCISKHCGHEINRIQPFVLNTLSLAYSLDKQYLQAQNILRAASESRSNLGLWQTYFITGCTFLLEGKLTEASIFFDKANNEAKKIGKQTVDSFLIAQAFVQMKQKNKAKAIEFLKSAHELNPYRVSVIKRLIQWQKNCDFK